MDAIRLEKTLLIDPLRDAEHRQPPPDRRKQHQSPEEEVEPEVEVEEEQHTLDTRA